MKNSAIIYTILFVFIGLIGFAGELPKNSKDKTVIISGSISDKTSNEYLAGVKIACATCQKIVYSDLDGKFFIYLEVKADENLKLEFSQIGYTTKTIDLKEVQANSSTLYIDLESE